MMGPIAPDARPPRLSRNPAWLLGHGFWDKDQDDTRVASDDRDDDPTMTPSSGFGYLAPFAASRAALLSALAPVPATCLPLAAALDRVAAATIRAPRPFPATRIATRDGIAVIARETVGATPYAPILLVPPPRGVRAGAAMPGDTDAVLPPHAIDDDGALVQDATPGQDTREPGGDLAAGGVILADGARTRAIDISLLGFAGVDSIVARVPRLWVEGGGPLAGMIATLALARGAALAGARDAADLVVSIGVDGLAGTGPIARGLAVRPGEGIALGTAPRAGGETGVVGVVVAPDRLDDVVAAWLLVIAPALDALAGATPDPGLTLALTQKIVSPPGLADLALLRRDATRAPPRWEPARGDLSWSAFAEADAYCLIPAESEGLPAGALVTGHSV
jgi:molybdopterin biosynthesis enzyme